ncbi:hypothetical protein Ahia01_000576700 [Argonauta hians]
MTAAGGVWLSPGPVGAGPVLSFLQARLFCRRLFLPSSADLAIRRMVARQSSRLDAAASSLEGLKPSAFRSRFDRVKNGQKIDQTPAAVIQD